MGQSRHVRPRSRILSYLETRVPSAWVHFHVPSPFTIAVPSRTTPECASVKRPPLCLSELLTPLLHHLTQSALPCLTRPEVFSQLFIDSFTMTVVCSHLVGRYGQLRRHHTLANSKAVWPRGKCGARWSAPRISGRRVKKLETLAGECRFRSEAHCPGSFRRSFGTSPHRYLTLRRVEIGRRSFLSRTRTALSWKLAAQTGFSDQAALTRTFANVVGATPGKWRREHSHQSGCLSKCNEHSRKRSPLTHTERNPSLHILETRESTKVVRAFQ